MAKYARNSRPAAETTSQLPGWVFLATGAVLLAGAVLVQPWLECRQLQRQYNIMQIQTDRLSQQEHAYSNFYTSLRSGDAVLLERLAYHHLGLKPVGVEVIDTPYTDAGTTSIATGEGDTAPAWSTPQPVGLEITAARGDTDHPSETLESWLHTPLPDTGAAWEVPRTRLVRLTTGLNQLVLTAAGLLCVTAGLLWSYNGGAR